MTSAAVASRLEAVNDVPPEVIAGIVLQLPLVGVVAYGFVSRRLRTAGEVQELEARHSREVAWLEARRTEERDGRIAAEKRVSDLTERWDQALGLLGGIEKELIRSAGRPGDAPR